MIIELKIIIYKYTEPHNIKKISQDFDYIIINKNNYKSYCDTACKSGTLSVLNNNEFWCNKKDIPILFKLASHYGHIKILEFLVSYKNKLTSSEWNNIILNELINCCNNSQDEIFLYLLYKFPNYKENTKLVSLIIYNDKINVLQNIGLKFLFANTDFLYGKAILYDKLNICKYFYANKLVMSNYCIKLAINYGRKDILSWISTIKKPVLNFCKYDIQNIKLNDERYLSIKYGVSRKGKIKVWTKQSTQQFNEENFIID